MGKVTNNFFDLLQPTIVKTSNDKELPEELRNRFFLNYNVLGIKYFEQYYLLSENGDGVPYLLMKEDNWGIELENSGEGFDKILDIPRLYIDITDKFINGSDMFKSFIFQAIMENAIYAGGTEEFVPGKDYWLNSTLYNYLANTNQIEVANFYSRMPNYVTEIATISKYFVDLSGTFMEDYTNLEYYEKKNRQRDHKYSDDELKDFYSNFCKCILENTLISDEKRVSGDNALYDIVLNYFANYKIDDASNALNIVLNGLYSTSYTSSTCACNSAVNQALSSSSNSEIYTKTCSSLYSEAMDLYLKQMLGDTNFYHDWFMIELSEYECEVNDVLTENLITMLNEFLEMDFNLDFSTPGTTWNCGTLNSDSSKSSNKIITNYIKVLEFVYNNNLTANTNKIKIWGENFGELLPNLQF